MKFSRNLLKQYISLDDSIDAISQQLTLKSCEVEEVITRTIPDNVLIGKATSVEQHPNADKLVVCQVNCGKAGNFQIITGGENMVADRFVPVAIPGCYLPVIDLTIGEREMRGTMSSGMICSKEEIGIMEDMDKHRIWLLDEDLTDLSDDDLGTPLGEKYPWLNNSIIDVDNKTLTHRPDMTGHLWLASELYAIYNSNHDTKQQISFTTIPHYYETVHNTNILQTIELGNKTSRGVTSTTDKLRSYVLLELSWISIQESSFYLRTLLRDADGQPKNNRVDFSNLFMLSTGQPVHFFDAAKVNGDIIVRQAHDGEQFTSLVGETYKLTTEDMVIADKDAILALAGVIGGESSAISESTTDIIVEIANFDPVSVRKTAQRHGIRTDASMRYEKNINPVITLHHLIQFLDELQRHQKDLGTYTIGWTTMHANDMTKQLLNQQTTIDVTEEDIQRCLFGSTKDWFGETISTILVSLGYEYANNTATIPYRRWPADMGMKHDIYEEVARIYGYETIDHAPMHSDVREQPFDTKTKIIRSMETIISWVGQSTQVETYPRVEEKLLTLFNADKTELFSLQNPSSPETKYMRNAMMYNLLQYAKKNSKFIDQCWLFDIGQVWKNNTVHDTHTGTQPGETTQAWIVLFTKKVEGRQQDTILHAKQLVQTIVTTLWITGELSYMATDHQYFHPRKQATITINNKEIGTIGQLHPLLHSDLKFDEQAQISSIEISISTLVTLLDAQEKNLGEAYYETIHDQIIRRDLSFLVDSEQPAWTITDAIIAIDEIQEVKVFDIYHGKNIPEWKKSLSLSFKMIGDGKRKTDHINAIMDQAIHTAQAHGWTLRE